VLGYFDGIEGVGAVVSMGLIACLLWFVDDLRRGEAPLAPSLAVLGIVHVGLCGAFAMVIVSSPHGFARLLVLAILTITLDVASYAWGSTLGWRPFLPQVSPKKTIGGLVGGVATTMIAAAVVHIIVSRLDSQPALAGIFSLENVLVLGAVVCVFGVVGDLAESLLKRGLGIKDMGSFLPGHGGMFDRFDAMLFVLPAAYVTFLLQGM
jgi:phosphatidate cytidylyltransferase